MPEKDVKIKERWEKQEEFYEPDSRGGTQKDFNITKLEIQNILLYLNDNDKVLDIGCGDGYATRIFAEKKNVDILGLDYSPQMIDVAKKRLKEGLKLNFILGDVLKLDFADNSFDKIITMRCLINLDTWEKQKQALCEIHRVLKKGGAYVMLEGSADSINNLNSLRSTYDLKPIPIAWHNLFFKEKELKEFALSLFESVEVDNFCSAYMAISRALHPALVAPEEPKYGAKINDLALQYPNYGDYGYLKIWLLKK